MYFVASPRHCYFRSFMLTCLDSPQGILVLVTVGGDRGVGHFLLAGTEENVSELGPK